MQSESAIDVLEDLEDLLDRERHALLDGDLEKVGRLTDQKEKLFEMLSELKDSNMADLSALKEKVERNKDLLNSALEGIRAVSTRLATLRRVRNTLETYDKNGAKKCIDLPKDSSVEKRA